MQKRSGGFRTHSRFHPLGCAMLGGRPPGAKPGTKCDACRRNNKTAASCQQKGHLAAAAGAANAAAAQPVPPGAQCAHTSHGAAPGPQQPANNPTLLPLAARGAPAESTSQRGAAPQQTQASEGRTSSARRLPAGRLQREQQRLRPEPRTDVSRLTLVEMQRGSGSVKLRALGAKAPRFKRWLRASFEFQGVWG